MLGTETTPIACGFLFVTCCLPSGLGGFLFFASTHALITPTAIVDFVVVISIDGPGILATDLA
jgi:hypothetical protein